MEKQLQKYPETSSYLALVQNRQRIRSNIDSSDEKSCIPDFAERLKQTDCRLSINQFSFVLNDSGEPLIATTLGHALSDAEPLDVLRKLLDCGADPLHVVQLESDGAVIDAENFLKILKKSYSNDKVALIADITSGNVLNKNYYKAVSKFLTEYAKEKAQFVEGKVFAGPGESGEGKMH
jgi:hypothetical protein